MHFATGLQKKTSFCKSFGAQTSPLPKTALKWAENFANAFVCLQLNTFSATELVLLQLELHNNNLWQCEVATDTALWHEDHVCN
jgi:hypothetical protein